MSGSHGPFAVSGQRARIGKPGVLPAGVPGRAFPIWGDVLVSGHAEVCQTGCRAFGRWPPFLLLWHRVYLKPAPLFMGATPCDPSGFPGSVSFHRDCAHRTHRTRAPRTSPTTTAAPSMDMTDTPASTSATWKPSAAMTPGLAVATKSETAIAGNV